MNVPCQIRRASIDDAEEILALQKLAYQSEAALYGNYEIPPLKETLEEVKENFREQVFLKAVSDDRIIGTVRGREKEGTCYIGRLAVLPESRDRGVGTALMRAIEGEFRSGRFELFTGSKSVKNIHLYQKLGYSVFKTSDNDCGGIQAVYMEKLK